VIVILFVYFFLSSICYWGRVCIRYTIIPYIVSLICIFDNFKKMIVPLSFVSPNASFISPCVHLFFLYICIDTVRKSISEAAISSPHADPPVAPDTSEFLSRKLSVKSQTCNDLGSHNNSTSLSAPLLSERTVRPTWTCFTLRLALNCALNELLLRRSLGW